jgi:hypothetical protein
MRDIIRLGDLRAALEKKACEASAEARLERARNMRSIAELASTHAGSMPNNYWQKEHRAQAKLEACMHLLDALDDVSPQGSPGPGGRA